MTIKRFWPLEKRKKAKPSFSANWEIRKGKEDLDFQQFVRAQLLKLRERGLSVPVASL